MISLIMYFLHLQIKETRLTVPYCRLRFSVIQFSCIHFSFLYILYLDSIFGGNTVEQAHL